MARTNLANKKQSEVNSDKNTNISVNYDFTKLEAGNYRFTREEAYK